MPEIGDSGLDKKLDIYIFWQWEYQRRNEEYRKAYDAFAEFEAKGNFSAQEMKDKLEVFCQRFLRAPRSYNIGMDTIDIVDDAMDESLDYEALHDPGSHNLIGVPTNAIRLVKKEGNHQFFLIDPIFPLEVIISQLEHYWYKYMAELMENEQGSIPIEMIDSINATMESLLLSRTNAGAERVRDNSLPRAIGLWFYDNIKSYKSLTATYTEFKKVFEDYYYGENPHKVPTYRRCREFLNRTRECIDRMEVLSLTGNRKPYFKLKNNPKWELVGLKSTQIEMMSLSLRKD